jgi:hypothetical protein
MSLLYVAASADVLENYVAHFEINNDDAIVKKAMEPKQHAAKKAQETLKVLLNRS